MFPLSDVLELPAFRLAKPQVLAGEPQAALVRWVHSSEVYEMQSLLSGGELLLTTGLGLHGRSEEQLASYVDQISDTGCVALALELGRSFLTVPPAMIQAAARRGLVLLALNAVVPFERYVEDFHELILARRLAEAPAAASLTRFVQPVLHGHGLQRLLDDVARAAGCQVEYVDLDATVVDRSRIPTLSSGTERTTVTISGPRGARGSLVFRASESPSLRLIADSAALAVALELSRAPNLANHPTAEQALISDLHAGALVSAGDVRNRLRSAGLGIDRHHRVVVIGLDATDLTASEVLAASRGVASLPPRVAGIVGGDVIAVLAVPVAWESAAVRERMNQAAQDLAATLGDPTGILLSVVGPNADPSELGASVQQTRDVLRLARRYGLTCGVVLAQDLGLQQFLTSGVQPEALAAFVTDQIGALIDSDRHHGATLIRTLDAYLRCSLSKAATAEALGIRRQSLYGRLARIEGLLGIRLDDQQHRTRLAVALTAWRLRTGIDPQTTG